MEWLPERLLDVLPEPICVLDAFGVVRWSNTALRALLGTTPEELHGRELADFAADGGAAGAERLISEAGPERPTAAAVLRLRTGAGKVAYLRWSVAWDAETCWYYAAAVDVTERTEEIRRLAAELDAANQTLEELVGTDELTGLWNRRKFFEEAEGLIKLLRSSGVPLSLIMADIDWFKDFNDRFGHLVGDEVLRRVAGVFTTVRSGSDFAARYGGEEFVVTLPGSDAEQATATAERLRRAVAELSWEGEPITVSVGVATLVDPGERGSDVVPMLDRLIDAADKAMYRSKARGKNCVTHAEDDGEGSPPT